MEPHNVFISIGSNIGDRKANCLNGILSLSGLEGVIIKKTSQFYETEPVDYRDQDWFVNAALRLKTVLSPFDLLDALKRVEKKVGRKENPVRFGPRVLDLDIILYDDLVLSAPNLIIPHPRMHERRFVLKPICDIAPDTVHPVMQRTIRQLLNALKDEKHQHMVDLECGY
ncbi:MAG: 2-amino-4-hydroxy-6-hydroxymethyldihydropteridine diphosphokinase [Desulfobacterales bacterium]|nr:2-amino-4-hydroxy-6-hydroxymethyldihydropteridine diphosphokinase [Desulfobacterales bacterium]